MASHIKRGESLLIPFRDGQSITDSQLKPRMYKTMPAFERAFPKHYLGTDGVEVVEYAEVVRCKDCRYRGNPDTCPMCHEEQIEWDDDGYTEVDWILHDRTQDEGFCEGGERKDNA